MIFPFKSPFSSVFSHDWRRGACFRHSYSSWPRPLLAASTSRTVAGSARQSSLFLESSRGCRAVQSYGLKYQL